MSAQEQMGVYVLGNDRVYEWMVAFLESFRAHNPALPLTLIPYDDEVARVAALQETYRFTILDDPHFAQLDEIGLAFAGGQPRGWTRMFRKLAAFWGPYAYAVYLDSDIVVVDELGELLTAFKASGRDFLIFDESDEHVYEEAFHNRMRREHGARPFNAGYWCCRTGALSFSRITRLAEEALAIRHEFYRYMDQPFINYCVHTAGLSYGALWEYVPDLAHHHWAARWRCIRYTGNTYRIGHRGSPDFGARVKLLHWAGSRVRVGMPYRDIFLHYRLRRLPPRAQRAYRRRAWVRYLTRDLWRSLYTKLRRLVTRVLEK